MRRPQTLVEIATAVRERRVSARAVVQSVLDDIVARDGAYNCFTRLFVERSLAEADAVDARLAKGEYVGSLAGVPYGVKDLFDVAGEPTTAGAAFRKDAPPALHDAEAVAALRAAGAVLVGTLNMDEFAYGFATDNAHFGRTRNPHDPERLAGGSSGGSAAAVAAGLVPLTLGSDTNGSIRVPAALCGVYGLRATHGLLSKEGSFPFAPSIDQVGPFVANVADMRAVFDVLRPKGAEASEGQGDIPLRVGRLNGWFRKNADARLLDAIDAAASCLGEATDAELPEVARARAAAFVITASEGGNLHLPDLKVRPLAFDPAVRDRLIAGALLPAATIVQAHRFRRWFNTAAHGVMKGFDLLIAPACGGEAPRADMPLIEVDGKMVSARANLGLYTQPLSLLGFPVLSVPLAIEGTMPMGAQIVAAPGRESLLFAAAEKLERYGLARAPNISFLLHEI